MAHGDDRTWHYSNLLKQFSGIPIDVYNHGQMVRDFTYIDDIVEGVVRLINKPAVAAETFNSILPDAGATILPGASLI